MPVMTNNSTAAGSAAVFSKGESKGTDSERIRRLVGQLSDNGRDRLRTILGQALDEAVTNYGSAVQNLLGSYNDRAGSYDGTSWIGDSADWMENVASQRDSISQQGDRIRRVLNLFGDMFDQEATDDIRYMLYQNGNLTDQILDTARRQNEQHGRFDSAEAWQSYAQQGGLLWDQARESGLSAEDWYTQSSETLSGLQEELERLKAARDAALAHGSSTSAMIFDEDGDYIGQDEALEEANQRAFEEADAAYSEALRRYNEAEQTAWAAGNWRYSELPENADFERISAEGMRLFEQDSQRHNEQVAEDVAAEEAAFYQGGTGGMTYERDLISTLRDDTSWREPREDWTAEERSIFGYLYARNPEEAYAYAERLNNQRNAESFRGEQEAAEEYAQRNFGTGVVSTAAGILSMPFALGDYMDYAAEYAARGRVTQRAGMSAADYGNIMTGAVAEKLNDQAGTVEGGFFDGKGLGDVYQLGVSIGQSLLFGHVFGAVGTTIAFFGSAAKSGFEDAYARGGDAGQALAFGFASGIAEAGCEYFSLDKLLSEKAVTGFASFLRETLKQAGVEASEEMMTTLCNSAADAIIMGDKSELQQQIRELAASGMSYEEASDQAMREWMRGVIMDGLGGAISGGISAGAEIAIQSRSRIDAADSRSLVEQGLAAPEGSAARRLAEQYAAQYGYGQENAQQTEDAEHSQEREGDPRGMRNFQAQRLIKAIEQGDRQTITTAARRRLEELGAENSAATAEAITEELLREDNEDGRYGPGESRFFDRSKLLNDPKALRVLNEMDPKQMRQQMKINMELYGTAERGKELGKDRFDWARDIGTQRLNADVYNRSTYDEVAKFRQAVKDLEQANRGVKAEELSADVTYQGESVRLEGMSLAEDGSARLKLGKADGSSVTVKPGAVDLPEATDALVRAVSKHGSSAALMFAAYQPGQPVQRFADEWDLAELYGRSTTKGVETALQEKSFTVLTEAQIRMAFEHGRELRNRSEAERAESKKETPHQSAERTASPQGEALKKGSVSFEGARIGDREFHKVNQSRLTQKQRNQIEAVRMLAEATGISFVFYESRTDRRGRYQGANGFYKDGVIYLDVNAGLHARSIGQVAIVRTAAHELTHFMKQHNRAQYEQLQTFMLDRLTEWRGRTLGELAEDKMARASTDLTMQEAIDEVTADGCEMMLRRTSVMQRMAEDNKGLFRTVRDWMGQWLKKLDKAFEGVEAIHDEAKAMTAYMERLQAMWDEGIVGAARNAQEERAVEDAGPYVENENAASDRDGEVEFQNRDYYDPETAGIKKQLENSAVMLNNMEPVAKKTVPYFQKKGGKQKAAAWAIEELKKTGYQVDKMGYGIVYFDESDIEKAARYADTAAEKGALGFLPEVIKRGKEIGRHENHDQRGKRTITFAAPIVMNGIRGNMAVVVNMRSNHFYAERIVLPDGSAFVLPEKKNTPQELLRGVVKNDSLAKATSGGSDNSIRDSTEKSNTQFQERDFMPTNRELLLEAAGDPRSSEELRRYARKVKTLEALNRKLLRQQEALEEAENAPEVEEEETRADEGVGSDTDTGEPEQAAGRQSIEQLRAAIEKTEAQIERAEKALEQMENLPGMKRAANERLAAWRDANPDEAAQAMRRLREENASLERFVDYWRKEARATEPGQQTAEPEDVSRLAKTLLAETKSDASQKLVQQRLQALADYMLQSYQGADVGVFMEAKRQAMSIAREIAHNMYQTNEENQELHDNLKNRIRETRIRIAELKADMADFEHFRRRTMGTFRFTNDGQNIDSVFQALRYEYGEGLFPADVTAPSDQLNAILDALQATRPVYGTVFHNEYEEREAAEYIANDILDRILRGDVAEHRTAADKSLERKYQRELEKLEKKDAKRQQKLNEAQDRARFAEAELDEQRMTRNQMVSRKVHELREKSIERDKAYRKRIAIDKAAKRLSKLLTENSAKKHIPEGMKADIGAFLLSIDTLSPRAGEKSRNEYLRRLRDLERSVARQAAYMRGQSDNWNGGYLDLPADLAERMEALERSAEEQIDGNARWTTAQMSLKQLTELEDILKNISKAVETADELLAGERSRKVSETAEPTIRYLDKLGQSKTDSAVSRFLQFQNTTPYYYFHMFGEGGDTIFKNLMYGWEKLAFHSREIIEYSEKAYTSEEAKRLEKETLSFELHTRLTDDTSTDQLRSEGTETVRMTKAQIMSLYALSRREQALGHLLGAGIRISTFKEDGKLKPTRQEKNYLLTVEDLAKITGTLTERERAIVDALQKHMNTVGSEWGNEVSMARFGTRQFTEPQYWPIQTDSRTRPVRDPGMDTANLFRLLNMSFTKGTIRDAHNAVVIESAFDTYANHMADMAKYNALGLPLLDAMKWFSYSTASEENENGQYTTSSVQKSAERAFGTEAQKYFTTFIKDMNGTHEGGRGEGFGAKMLSNYKVAAVGANLRVALLQPTAFVRAVALIDPKYLAAGMNPAKVAQGIKEAMEFSGTAAWKDLGFYDTNVNANLRELIKHADTTVDVIREKSMWLAEKGDKITWGAIWNAVKAEQQATKGLSGDALIEATRERFMEVIYRTQVMDSTMTRSHNMRQKGVYASMTTAFMSEPTLSYNMILSALNEYRAARRTEGDRSAAWQKVKGQLGRAFVAYAASAAAASIAESLMDAWRDDDKYESFAEKWLEAEFGGGKLLEGNLIGDLMISNKLPVVKDFVSLAQGFSNGRMDTEWMANIIKAGQIWAETIRLATGAQDKPTSVTYNGKMTSWGKIYQSLKALSQLSGLPGGNLGREVAAVWNNTAGKLTGNRLTTYDSGPKASVKYGFQDGYLTEDEAVRYLLEEGVYEDESEARKQVYEWSLGETGKYDAILAAAHSGNDAAFDRSLNELLGYGYAESSVRERMRRAIREWYQGTEEEPQSISKPEAIRMLTTYGGYSDRDAAATVQQWTCQIVTGVAYDQIGEEYVAGNLSTEQAVEMRMTYGGQTEADASAQVLRWQCERDTGYAYTDIRELYVSGEIGGEQARDWMARYGGRSEEDIDKTLAQYDFAGDDPNLQDISGAAALRYFEQIEETGIDRENYYTAWRGLNALTSDRDENGETVRDSLMMKRIAFIDSLSLSPAQKDALFLLYYAEKNLKYTTWH